jgi:hypothetical protein
MTMLGFLPKPLVVSLDKILPSRKVDPIVFESSKFQQMKVSIEKVGLIEPLSVLQFDRKLGGHVLVDGHLRRCALQQAENTEADCLVATDDEAYTYNNRLNRLSTVQEHVMIRRAIDRGVPPAEIAEALGLDISVIMRKRRLLDNICPEVVEMLKDRTFSPELTPLLRKMKPTRQIECVELMISANNLTLNYARAMLLMTPAEMLVDGKRPTRRNIADPEQMQRMDREMANVTEQYRLAEQNYAEDMLKLMLGQKYVERLLQNQNVMRHLQKHHPDMLDEFSRIVEAAAIDH